MITAVDSTISEDTLILCISITTNASCIKRTKMHAFRERMKPGALPPLTMKWPNVITSIQMNVFVQYI